MPASEPSRHWQIQKHQQILNEDSPTAFAQLSELALPHLIEFLQHEFRQFEVHFHETAAIDSLLTYHNAPEKYNAEKLTLFAYLRMAARHDLLNAIDRSNRQQRPLLDIDQPHIQSQLVTEASSEPDPFYLDQWLDNGDSGTSTMLRQFETALDATDHQMFLLMLNGVRETEPYAEIMQLTSQPLPEQRREVKRAKDRLTKKLARYVNRQQN
jgi:DNA-directed RNA polymerase specialized sigma24 family protein